MCFLESFWSVDPIVCPSHMVFPTCFVFVLVRSFSKTFSYII